MCSTGVSSDAAAIAFIHAMNLYNEILIFCGSNIAKNIVN